MFPFFIPGNKRAVSHLKVFLPFSLSLCFLCCLYFFLSCPFPGEMKRKVYRINDIQEYSTSVSVIKLSSDIIWSQRTSLIEQQRSSAKYQIYIVWQSPFMHLLCFSLLPLDCELCKQLHGLLVNCLLELGKNTRISCTLLLYTYGLCRIMKG